MRRILFVVTCFGLLFGAAQAQMWWDDFDSYVTTAIDGKMLSEKSLWEMWDGGTVVDAAVSKDQGSTLGDSTRGDCVMITGQTDPNPGNDVVFNFDNIPGGQPTSGYWSVTADVYVPNDSNGRGMYIMLNQYPLIKNWSLQVDFYTGPGIVRAVEPTPGFDAALIFDEWITIITNIDLDGDKVDFWYGDSRVINQRQWIDDGLAQIACVDLYGHEPATPGVKYMYYDNFQIERLSAPGVALTSRPNPVAAGSPVTLKLNTEYSSGKALFMLWSVNQTSFRSPILAIGLDASGDRTIGGNVPPAAAGMLIGVKAYAIPQGGGQMVESNQEMIVVR